MSVQSVLLSLSSSHLLVAKEVEEDQVIKGVRATFIPSQDVACFRVFIIEEAFSA